MAQRLPELKDWKVFQQLCRVLWSTMDRERDYEEYGREGQDQRGIDVRGGAPTLASIGIQCKVRQQFLRSFVSTKDIDAWIDDAVKGGLPLGELVIATTAPRDAAIDEHVKQRSDAHHRQHKFRVSYWSWDRIEDELFAPQRGDVLAQFFKQFGFRTQRRQELADYLDSLRGELQKIPMRYLRDNDEFADEPVLAAVYTMLDVAGQVHADGPLERGPRDRERAATPPKAAWTLPCDPVEAGELVARVGREAAAAKKEAGDAGRPATVLEAIATNPRLVITGVGGSGKSTIARYLALCLTDAIVLDVRNQGTDGLAALTAGDRTQWTHGLLAPLWIELRDFAASTHFPKRGEATAESLWHFLANRPGAALAATLRGNLTELMAPGGSVPGVLLILDGIDELPNRDEQTPVLMELLGAFLRQHPQCRVLLTSRPYAVADAKTDRALQQLAFRRVELGPPSDRFVERFLAAWFAEQPEQAEVVRDGLAARPELRRIVETPLLLTLVAILFESEAQNWRNVGDVLESAVHRLVDHWNFARGIPGAGNLAPHMAKVRKALDQLAWNLQCKVQAGADGNRRFDEGQLVPVLRQQLGTAWEELHVDLYLQERCGILQYGDGKYWFPHRHVQEFLVATHARGLADAPLPLLTAAETQIDDWAEVVSFAAALGARGQQVELFTLLDYLVPELEPAPTAANDPRFARIGLGARIVESLAVWSPARPQDRAKLERLRRWCRHCADLGALRPVPRALVGRVLGRLGDDRKGVGLDRDGLPDIDWVRIKPQKSRAYDIARYPVTNTQFDAFVADGGYTAKWDACWTAAGLEWRKANSKPRELAAPFSVPNHPRVDVTLHEAVAFANWLAAKRKQRKGSIRLPTSDEWQLAARGTDQRTWAWGNDYGDGTRSNGHDARIGSTCAVGIFPQGETPDHRVQDMSGNALNWALRAEDREGEKTGSVWGGSWLAIAGGLLRAGFVGGDGDFGAVHRGVDLGFRLAAPAST